MAVPYCQNKKIQKQSSRGIFRKKHSENIQQIYRGAPTPTCDFNKNCFATLLKLHLDMGVLLYICCMFSEQLYSESISGRLFADSNGLVVAELKGCVRCIFANLFCKSKEGHL